MDNNDNNIIEKSKKKKNKKKKRKKENDKYKNKNIILINNNPPKKIKIKNFSNIDKKETIEITKNPDSKIEFKNLDKSKNNEKKPVIDISLLNNNKRNSQNVNKINDIQFSYYNEYELNKLAYKDALLQDKRTYFKYYFSIVKRNNLLIFAFFVNNDYNPKIIKISIFSFSIALYLFWNVPFINDSTIQLLYYKEGSFDIGYHNLFNYYFSDIYWHN